MISIVTNYASMVGNENLQTTNDFQTKTVEALTSGYRINSSGDDPAGLAVANQYRDNISELTQGVINANTGVSTCRSWMVDSITSARCWTGSRHWPPNRPAPPSPEAAPVSTWNINSW